MTTTVSNPYLAGNFAPVRSEITSDRLSVIGELPSDLHGIFVRNGPNPQFPPIGQYHWFDGDGMLHGVEIKDGQATYCNRYIKTAGFKREQQAGRAIWTGILEPSQPSAAANDPQIKNTANTALIWHADQLMALWEGGEPHIIEVPSLETVGAYNYGGKLTSAFTAHPKVDAQTGEMIFFGYSLAQPPYLQYSLVSPTGELQRTVPIDLPVGVMMHDFAITANYTIFMDLPLTFRLERLQQGKPAFMFEPETPSRFGILPRHGDNSSVRWFEAPACYVFHTLNAYEAGDEVVLLACRMDTTTVLSASQESGKHEGDNQLLQSDIPRLYRWRFNLKTGAVRSELLDDTPAEFPRVNEQYVGQPTRYGYTARMNIDSEMPLFNGLIKNDFSNGSSQTHYFGAGCYGGEAVFVPRPDATTEDDGWLLTIVRDELEQTSSLIVVNAMAITEPPVARIILPQRVPYGFHGTWIAQN